MENISRAASTGEIQLLPFHFLRCKRSKGLLRHASLDLCLSAIGRLQWLKHIKILYSEASQKNEKIWGWIMRKQKLNWFSNYSLVGSLKIGLSGRRRVILWVRRPWHSPSLFCYFPKAVRIWQTQIDFAFPCSMHTILLSYVWQVLTFSREKNSVRKVAFYSWINSSKTLSVKEKKDPKLKGMQRSSLCVFGKDMPYQTCGAKMVKTPGNPDMSWEQ